MAKQAKSPKKGKSIKKARRAARFESFILVLVLALALYSAYTFKLKPEHEYAAAQECLTAGDYAGAEQRFAALGEYKDSADEEQYAACMREFESGSIAEAVLAYTWLDAAHKQSVLEHIGQPETLAENALNEGRYADARAYYSICAQTERIKQVLADLDARDAALALIAENKYSEARSLLAETDESVADIAVLKTQCLEWEYAYYELLFDTDADAAVCGMTEIDEYPPAAQFIKNLEQGYAQAIAYMEAGDYDSAAVLFAQFGNFRDSEELLDECLNPIVEEPEEDIDEEIMAEATEIPDEIETEEENG